MYSLFLLNWNVNEGGAGMLGTKEPTLGPFSTVNSPSNVANAGLTGFGESVKQWGINVSLFYLLEID